MPITSRDLDLDSLMADLPPPSRGPRPAAPPKVMARSAGGSSLARRAYGTMGLLIGGIAWPIGAWYTAAGWAWLVNALLGWAGLAWQIPAPSGSLGLVAAGAIGLGYSMVETHPPERGRDAAGWLFGGAIWLLVIASDVGTTLAGTMTRPITATPLTLWIAATPAAALVWSILLTFAPDQAILRGWRMLWGR